VLGAVLAAAPGLAAPPLPADPAGPVAQAGPPGPVRNFALETLTDGVVAVIRKDPAGLMVDANDVFIVCDEEVVVVDTNGSPSITREVLAALKRLTPKPVRYVVNTHYHDDHIRGNAVYRDAFPGVAFVAHPFARDYLPAQGAENRKSFLTGAPQFLEQLKGMLARNESLLGGELSAEERASMESDIALASAVLEDGAAAETVLPTITVADRMVLHRGRRSIEILALGSGHTAADLVVHLPEEGIVITGDLVAWPVPLVGSPQSHIAEWAATLGRIRDLHPKIIVPGHGPVLRDDRYLAALQEMFSAIASGAKTAAARGLTLEEARKAIDLKPFRDALAGDSRVRRILFSTYVAGPAVEAAFNEAAAVKAGAAKTGAANGGGAATAGGAPRTAS
jgi:glyoxylase-like metal-dependent hydrolase (beta-lactamase superfamily II)